MRVRYINIAAVLLGFITQSCLLPSNEYLFENTEQTVVIEGRISNCDTLQQVLVSKTVFGENTTDNQFINDAVVRIVNENNNITEELDFVGSGKYVTSKIEPEMGAAYRLEVEVEGGVYVATESVTSKPDISHVFSIFQDEPPYEPGEYLFFVFGKQKDSLAFYKIEVEINNKLQNEYSDLMVLDNRLFSESQLLMLPYALYEGDTVNVCVYALSELMYEYYLGLSKQTTNLYSNIQPPQINPSNNFNNEVLGYFQVSSVYQLDTVIQNILVR